MVTEKQEKREGRAHAAAVLIKSIEVQGTGVDAGWLAATKVSGRG